MSTFVKDFNTGTPLGTDSRAKGDDDIRDSKEAVRERLAVEHDFPTASGSQSGRHKFSVGNTAARPTDPAVGSIHLNTQTSDIDIWTGSAWATLIQTNHFYQAAAKEDTTDYTLSNLSDTILTNTTITIAQPGDYLVFTGMHCSFSSLGANQHVEAIGTLYKNAVSQAQVWKGGYQEDALGSGFFITHGWGGATVLLTGLVAGDTVSLHAVKSNGNGSVRANRGFLTIMRVKVS